MLPTQNLEPCRIPGHYNSYAITIRPRNGVVIDSPLQIAMVKWFLSQDYFFLCSEKEGVERHLHGQVWFNNGRMKGPVTKSLKLIQEKYDPDWDAASQKVASAGVKIAYSKDWVEEYLSKEEKWILNQPPPTTLEHLFYPSKEEQEKVKSKAHAVDQQYHRYKELWDESRRHHDDQDPYDKNTVGKFMYEMMFVSKRIRVQMDTRKRIQMRDCLYHYLICDIDKWKDMFMSKVEKEQVLEKLKLEEDAAPLGNPPLWVGPH